MNGAKLGDVYRDSLGDLWQVSWTCHEPTIGMVRLYPSNDLRARPSGEMSGGVSGFMWEGFVKLEPKP